MTTLELMNQRFRVIEGMWKVGSAQEQDEFRTELIDMRAQLAKINGPEADSALWLGRTIDRITRNMSVARAGS
jgi:hypothetical protein